MAFDTKMCEGLVKHPLETRPYVTVMAGVLDPATVGDGSLIGVGDDGVQTGEIGNR